MKRIAIILSSLALLAFGGCSALDDGIVLACAGADEAIIVVNPDYSSLRDADNLDRELVELGLETRHLVVNNVDMELVELKHDKSITVICAQFENIESMLVACAKLK